jgi:hypothetical protein
VLSQACSRAAEWNVLSPDPLVMNVNVSGVQLMHPGFPGVVSDLLRGTGLPPGLLTLELTESVLVDERVGQVLTELRELGVGIAIDDFGTGYSSLSMLSHFPVDVLKTDRSFVSRMNIDESDAGPQRAADRRGDGPRGGGRGRGDTRPARGSASPGMPSGPGVLLRPSGRGRIAALGRGGPPTAHR